jgi:hypothetical protein
MIFQIFTRPYRLNEEKFRLVITYDTDGNITDVIETSKPDSMSKTIRKLHHHNALQLPGFHLMPNSYDAIVKGFQNPNRPPVAKKES